MVFRVVFTLCLVLTVLESVIGAPRTIKNEEDLEKSFVEFLHQDKELAPLLDKADFKNPAAALSRIVRQAEIEGNDGLSGEEAEPPRNKDGFFDRAAKFVMEVLQRFLKWVNSDN